MQPLPSPPLPPSPFPTAHRPRADRRPGAVRAAGCSARLGFPSPADDFMDDAIDLHRLLVRNPASTFLYRADCWSMSGVGVSDGDNLVVDRSVTPQAGDLAITIWEGNQPTR